MTANWMRTAYIVFVLVLSGIAVVGIMAFIFCSCAIDNCSRRDAEVLGLTEMTGTPEPVKSDLEQFLSFPFPPSYGSMDVFKG